MFEIFTVISTCEIIPSYKIEYGSMKIKIET